MRSEDRSDSAGTADQGSALVMVLAFMIISALIIIPMLTYASTVLRVNTVSVDKREQLETVRGGARVAIADPIELFRLCDNQSAFATLPTPAVESVTQCRQISQVGVTAQLTIPHGAVAMQPGEQVSAAPFDGLTFAEPPAAASHDWWLSTDWAHEPTAAHIWLPHLPRTDSNVQSSDGHALPSPYACRVFFPGTYEQPVVLDEPAYFASGTYSFKESISIVGGGDVVAGFGFEEGCANDLQAFSDIDPLDSPSRFNIDGQGVTFVLNGDARLIVDDTKTLDGADNPIDNTGNLPAKFRMNQRYVFSDSDGGARVSIMTVNGDTEPVDALDPDGPSFVQDLTVTDQIFVPESEVVIPQGDTSTTVLASTRDLVPSTHTAETRPPSPPVITAIHPAGEPRAHDNRQGAAFIQWAAPTGSQSGGSTITQYEVFDSNGNSRCVTSGALHCTVIDLAEMNSNTTTTFTLVATNALGASDPSEPFSVEVRNNDDRLAASQAPTNVVVDQAAADGAFPADQQRASVSWDAPEQWPAGVPNAPDNDPWFSPPTSRYDVTVERVYVDHEGNDMPPEAVAGGCFTEPFYDQPAPATCLVEGLPPLDTTDGAGPETVPGVPAVIVAGIEVTPAIPAEHGTWVGYRFLVNSTIPVTTTHDPASPLLVSELSAPSNAIAVFDGSGTATPPAPNMLPVAPPFVPEPVVDIKVPNSASSKVIIAGYTSIPQGRLHITNPHVVDSTNPNVSVEGGTVAGTYDIDLASFGSTTVVGFQDTVLQRTIQVITTLPDSNRTSTMTLQINANGADVAVNSWVTQ